MTGFCHRHVRMRAPVSLVVLDEVAPHSRSGIGPPRLPRPCDGCPSGSADRAALRFTTPMRAETGGYGGDEAFSSSRAGRSPSLWCDCRSAWIQPSRRRSLIRQPIRGGFVPATREGRERSPPEAPSAEPSVLRTTSPRARRPARLPRPSRVELLVRADRPGRFCRRPERSCVLSIPARSLCLWGGALER